MMNEIAAIQIKSDKKLIRPVINFARTVAGFLGFDEKDLGDIELLVEEACLNAL